MTITIGRTGLRFNIDLVFGYLFFTTLTACWGVSNKQNQQQHKQQQHKHACNCHKETIITQQKLPYTDKSITIITDCYILAKLCIESKRDNNYVVVLFSEIQVPNIEEIHYLGGTLLQLVTVTIILIQR